MEKFSTTALKILAWFCAALFVVTTAIALLFFNAERKLFNADSYLRALDAQNFYEQIPALAADVLTHSSAQSGIQSPPDFLKALPPEDWEEVIRAVLPAEMSKSITEQGVTSIFAYLNGESDTAALSLVPFKTYLGGPDGMQAVVTLLNAQPDCTFAQLAEMTALTLLGEPLRFYLCKLPGEYTNASGNYIFRPMIQEGLQVTAANLPDEINLVPQSGTQDSTLRALRDLRRLLRFSPLIPFGLLFLITIFAVRDLKSWLRWWGTPFIAAGLLGLLTAASINPLFNWAYANSVQPSLSIDLPVSLTNTLRAVVSTVLAGVSAPIAFQSIFFLIAGIIMLLATRAKKKGLSPESFLPPITQIDTDFS